MRCFEGQTAIITGASGAIGQAIATRLLDGGATVCLVGRSRESLAGLQATMNWPAERVHRCVVDFLGDDATLTQFCTSFGRRFARLDILVHCAGAIAVGCVQNAPVEDLDAQYRVNVRAPFRLTQLLLPQLIADRGQIVFINSSAGLNARRGLAQYSATKHGLRAVADSVREEVNEHGVRVLSVFLGRTASKMQAAVHEREGRPYRPELLLQPDEVGSVVVHALGLPRTAEVTDVSMRPLLKSY
jgi:NADP-dependent 3-hydroxy acid dehydrogenase YdfG